jgi:hypothetical protein
LILKKQQRGGVMGYEEVLCLCSHENLSHTQPVLLLWIISHPVQRNCTMHILAKVDHCRDRDHEIPVEKKRVKNVKNVRRYSQQHQQRIPFISFV